MATPSKATVWDDRAHLILLQAIVQEASINAPEWDRIIQYTRQFGYNYTMGAATYSHPFLILLSCHFQRTLPRYFPLLLVPACGIQKLSSEPQNPSPYLDQP